MIVDIVHLLMIHQHQGEVCYEKSKARIQGTKLAEQILNKN
jgi:hypothetical protein